MAEVNTVTDALDQASQIEAEKLASVKKADAAVKTMSDFTSPEVLYQELISSVRKYHPSTDISMIEKAIRLPVKHIRIRKENPESPISFILCV